MVNTLSIFRKLILVGAIFLAANGQLLAMERALQPLNAITVTAEKFLQNQLNELAGAATLTVRSPDRRLALSHCSQPLQAFLPRGSGLQGSITVGVRCPGPTVWKVYLSAHIEQQIDVWVVKSALPKGHIVGPQDIELVTRSGGRLPRDPVTERARILGMSLRKTLASGTAIRLSHLQKPILIVKGERIALEFDNNQIRVNMTATALENGAKGESIKVRNERSQRTIDAIVSGPKLARVLP